MDLFTYAMNDRMKAEAPSPAALRSCAEHNPRSRQAAMLRIALRTHHRSRPPLRLHPPLGSPRHRQTTLAMCIANQTRSDFVTLSAVMAGKAELSEVIKHAIERRKLYGAKTILFVKDVLQTLN